MASNQFSLTGATPGILNQQMNQTTTPATSFSTKPSIQFGGFVSQGQSTQPSMPKSTPTYSTQSSQPSVTNTYQPLLDYQRSTGGGTSMSDLSSLASKYGISGYTGTDAQNQQLASSLKSQPSSQTGNAGSYTPQTGTTSGVLPDQTYQTPTYPTPTYSGLISQLSRQAQMTPEELALKQREAQLSSDIATRTGLEEQMPETNAYQTGRAGIIARVGAQQLQGLAQQEQAYAAQRGVASDALGKAAQLAAPIQQPYSSQLVNPLTGEPYSATGGSLSGAVQTVADRVKNGQMTYDQAVQALSGYGQGGLNALQQALPQGYNVAQSSALASQQGTIKPAYDYAQTALKNLQNVASNLGIAQGTNVPAINAAGNAVSWLTGIGSQNLAQYQGALAEARQAIQSVLASVRGGTPTEYVGQSQAMLPDNATPNQIQAAINTLTSLGAAKVNIYSNPGAAGSTSSGSLYSW